MTSQDSIILQKLASLKQSKFRSTFRLSKKDREYIASKGLETIKEHAYQFVNSRIALDFPKNDGKQTPMRGHPVFIAQHATATCCRKCSQKWHRIEKGRVLNELEVDFVVALIMGWIERQLWGFEKFRVRNHKRCQKKRGMPSDNSGNLLPPLHIASYSLLGNMRDALKGTTLIYCIRMIHPTHYPGFHRNLRINRWFSKLSSLFNSDELFKRMAI